MAKHALLIGVSQFVDARLAKLNAPASDVEALGAVLRDRERGGFNSVAVSIDDDFLVLRDRLAALFEKRDPDDLLLLYYSGHGILGQGNRLFLATPASNFDRPQARSLAAAEIRDLMDQTRAERQVIVLDCCHSGVFAEGAKGAAAARAVTQDTFDASAAGRYVLTAADAQQFAWDGDSLRDSSPAERKLSRFTSWLVEGLARGEAAPEDERITMDALFRYVCRRAKAEGSPATPQRYVDRGTGDLVIARNPAAAGPAWQALLSQLAANDWATRMAAVAELGRIARRDGSGGEAREALIERLGVERDYKVRGAIEKILGLRGGEAPGNQEQRRQEPPPKPPPEPPKPPPDPSPPLALEWNDRERARLQKLGVPREEWDRLPPPVVDRVRLYDRALRNTRWLLYATCVLIVYDLATPQLLRDPRQDPVSVWGTIGLQIAGGLVGLLSTISSRLIGGVVVPQPAPAAYTAVTTKYVVVKLLRAVFERRALQRLSAVLIAAGVLTAVAVPSLMR